MAVVRMLAKYRDLRKKKEMGQSIIRERLVHNIPVPMCKLLVLLLGSVLPQIIGAFHPLSRTATFRASPQSQSSILSAAAAELRRSRCATRLSSSDEETDEFDEDDMEEFVITPSQVKALRKEARQRRARKALRSYALLPEEGSSGSPLTEKTATAISRLFEENELVEIRAVSKDDNKEVFNASELLATNLELACERIVVPIDIKGFKVVMYSPMEEGTPGKIPMRSSFQEGKWSRKPKAIRDNRGQVTIDENGKSIKEQRPLF